MAILGLDIGSSGCKSVVYDDDGKVICGHYESYSARIENGRQQMDMRAVLEKVKKTIYQAAKTAKSKIEAIGITSFGESFVAVDANANPLDDTLMYSDNSGTDEAKWIENRLGAEKIAEISGVKVSRIFSLPKLLWLKKNRPEIYSKAYCFLPPAAFVAFYLTGACASDYSLLSRTMAFDVRTKRYSETLLETCDIAEKKLPKPIRCGEIISTVRPEIAAALGLSGACVVVSGGHDQICAAVGSGITACNDAADVTGTVECITPIFDCPLPVSSILDYGYASVPYIHDNQYCTYAFNYTGGALLKWYAANMLKQETGVAASEKKSVYEYLSPKIKKAPTGILVLPHFAGAATPYMDDGAKGVILGLKTDHTYLDIYKAIMEGVTYEMRTNLKCLLKSGVQVAKLCASGGGAKAREWLQIKADILNMPVESTLNTESGTTGCAILASLALKKTTSFSAAVKRYVKKGETFLPNKETNEQYEQLFFRYEKLYASTKNI